MTANAQFYDPPPNRNVSWQVQDVVSGSSLGTPVIAEEIPGSVAVFDDPNRCLSCVPPLPPPANGSTTAVRRRWACVQRAKQNYVINAITFYRINTTLLYFYCPRYIHVCVCVFCYGFPDNPPTCTKYNIKHYANSRELQPNRINTDDNDTNKKRCRTLFSPSPTTVVY